MSKTSLMSKKKQELIDIILRKDDVEVSLKHSLSEKDNEINKLQKDLEEVADNLATSNCELGELKSASSNDAKHIEVLEKSNKNYKTIAIVLGVALAISNLLWIILL